MRDLPDPGFGGDDGSVDPAVSAALAAYDADPEARHASALVVLQHARLLVPVVAVLGEVEDDDRPDGTRPIRDKTSDMATVLMTGHDGRTALLAFTGTEALHRWDPQARPVPVSMRRAAQAALQDGAAALLVDVAGPALFVVETDDLRELAEGRLLVQVGVGVSGRFGWAAPGR